MCSRLLSLEALDSTIWIELEEKEELKVTTEFGDPSDKIMSGKDWPIFPIVVLARYIW